MPERPHPTESLRAKHNYTHIDHADAPRNVPHTLSIRY